MFKSNTFSKKKCSTIYLLIKNYVKLTENLNCTDFYTIKKKIQK